MAARRIDPRLIKLNRTYDVAELARRLGVHRNTVRHWQGEGLRSLDGGRPVLFHGSTIRDFLGKRNARRKSPCPQGTLYCFKCRAPRPKLSVAPAGATDEALWAAYVAAVERSKETLSFEDGLLAGHAYAGFVKSFVTPSMRGRS